MNESQTKCMFKNWLKQLHVSAGLKYPSSMCAQKAVKILKLQLQNVKTRYQTVRRYNSDINIKCKDSLVRINMHDVCKPHVRAL
jgi:O-phosphoseryl-tRNA(Cys) synthetase